MLMAAKKHLKLIWLYFKFNLAGAMEYRGSFLTQLLGMMLNNASFMFFWWILFSKVGSIGGYRFADVMIIWAIASSSFGIAHIFFGNVGSISDIIINGGLDVYLLQPKDVLLNLLASKMIVSAWGDFFYGCILFVLAAGFDPIKLVLFLLFSLLGGLLMAAILTLAHTLTFFIGNASAITGLVTEFLITFSIYPEGIFKGIARLILYTIIPAGFISFLPLSIINSFRWPLLLLVVLLDAFYLAITYYAFKKGLARYESGNFIIAKL